MENSVHSLDFDSSSIKLSLIHVGDSLLSFGIVGEGDEPETLVKEEELEDGCHQHVTRT
jgi:hypothetical protein